MWGWETACRRDLARLHSPACKSCSTAAVFSSPPQSTVQSYLEGVSTGLEQLRSATQEVQAVCQELGAARWALLDSAEQCQGLQQMRALMADHVQLASVVQVLPQLFSGKALAPSSWIIDSFNLGLDTGLAAKLEEITLALLLGFGKSPWMEASAGPDPAWCTQSSRSQTRPLTTKPTPMTLVPAPAMLPMLTPSICPPSSTVHEAFSHTLQLLHRQCLLEAHAELMMMEHLRDDILRQLHLRGLSGAQATVLSYFSGLQDLNERLAKQLWDIAGSSLRLVRQDPALFVSAVRIVEREERIDDTLLLEATFLPPGRPKGWRQKFQSVLQESLAGARFRGACVGTAGPALARHLAALREDVVSELRVVKDLMVQCVPAHYNILGVCAAAYHQALAGHLQELLREDLDKQGLFLLLEWALRVYHRSAPAPAPTGQREAVGCPPAHGWVGCLEMTRGRGRKCWKTQVCPSLPHLCPAARR